MNWHLWSVRAFFVVGFLAVCAPLGEAKSDPKDIEKIRGLIAHNLDTYNSIKSLRLIQEWDYSLYEPGFASTQAGRYQQTHKHTYIQRGNWIRFDHTSSVKAKRSGQLENDRTQGILTDRYLAWIPTLGINSVRYAEAASMDDLPEYEKKLVLSSVPRHAAMFGFDIGPRSIGSRLELHPDIVTWSVTEETVDGAKVYNVKRSGTRYTKVYTFDPNKGYLITKELSTETTTGKLGIDLTIIPEKVDGVWLAKQVDEIDDLNDSVLHFRVLHAAVNRPISDADFHFNTLDFDRTTAVMERYDFGSSPEYFVFRENTWVPRP